MYELGHSLIGSHRSRSLSMSSISSSCSLRLRKNLIDQNIGLDYLKSQYPVLISAHIPKWTVSSKCLVTTFATSSLLQFSGGSNECATSGLMHPTDSKRSEVADDFSINLLVNKRNRLESQLEALFNEVKTMIKSGKEEDAVSLLQANYEIIKDQMDSGAQGIEEAVVIDIIALGYMALGDLPAVSFLINALNNIVNKIKDEESRLDSILTHMGSMYAKLEQFETSVGVYRRSLKVMEGKYGKDSLLLCTPLLGLAKALGSSGRATEAIEKYQQVITLLQSSRAREGEELLVPLFALGDLLLKEGRVKDAEYTFNRVLEIYVRSYGETDGRVGIAMCSLAKAKCAKGDVSEAINIYQNAIQIVEESKYLALDDKMMENMRIYLAELLHVVGRDEEGRALLEECFLISEKFNGKEHPSLVPHLVNLATSYSRSKKYVEAERLLRISLHIIMKNVPSDDPFITFPMLQLAITLYNLHCDEEAESYALDALHIREKAFGKESLPVGEALDCLVCIQSRLEKDESKMMELLKRVLIIQEKAFGPESEEVVTTLKKIVHYMDKMGLKNEMYPLEKRLSVQRNKHRQNIPS